MPPVSGSFNAASSGSPPLSAKSWASPMTMESKRCRVAVRREVEHQSGQLHAQKEIREVAAVPSTRRGHVVPPLIPRCGTANITGLLSS